MTCLHPALRPVRGAGDAVELRCAEPGCSQTVYEDALTHDAQREVPRR